MGLIRRERVLVQRLSGRVIQPVVCSWSLHISLALLRADPLPTIA
jgi:hypothetical protein